LAVSEAQTIVCDVDATMNYVVRGEKATFHAGDRSKSYWPVEEHRVTIRDMRPIAEELSFDRNGFVLLDEPTKVTDFADADQLALYCRETEAMVQRLTGAARTVSFGAILRTNATGAHGHNQPWRGRGLIGLAQSQFHVARNRAGDQQHIRVTRRGDEVDAKPFDVIHRAVQPHDLDFAAVARPGINLADVERPAQHFSDARLQLGTETLQRGWLRVEG